MFSLLLEFFWENTRLQIYAYYVPLFITQIIS